VHSILASYRPSAYKSGLTNKRGRRNTNSCNFLTELIIGEASLVHLKLERNNEMALYVPHVRVYLVTGDLTDPTEYQKGSLDPVHFLPDLLRVQEKNGASCPEQWVLTSWYPRTGKAAVDFTKPRLEMSADAGRGKGRKSYVQHKLCLLHLTSQCSCFVFMKCQVRITA
jgi:hypothetical protein